VQEGDTLAFGAQSGNFVDEAHPVRRAPAQCVVDIFNGETDVMDSGPSAGDELADGGVGRAGLQEFDQGFAGGEAGDVCAIGVVERHFDHAEDVTVEGQELVERCDGESDVGDTGAAWCGICHDRKNFSGEAAQLAAHDR
jgi:hypothetical protein